MLFSRTKCTLALFFPLQWFYTGTKKLLFLNN